MKKLLFALFAISLFSCKEESKVEEAVAKIPVEFKVERFDQVFYQSKPEDLQKIKAQYPFFFPAGDYNKLWSIYELWFLEKIETADYGVGAHG